MWTCTVLLACLAAFASAHSLPEESDRHFQAKEDFLQKQLSILQLFQDQYDAELYESFSKVAKSFKLQDNIDHFKNPEPVKKFLALYEHNALFPKTSAFTLYEYWPREEAKLLFDLFFFAKDFDIFFQTAAYLKFVVNTELFYYSLRTALAAREDTLYFYYPPTYETEPYYFLDERVIQQAYDATFKALKTGDYKPVSIPANYTGYWEHSRDPESVLAYFREDVGLNMLNVEFGRRFPAWFNTSRYGEGHDRKGELFVHYQRQLLARYFLERLSNNLGETPFLSVDEPLEGYFPGLRSFTGELVTPRQPYTKIRGNSKISLPQYFEYVSRIRDAIKRGYALAENRTFIPLRGEKALNTLGEMLAFVADNVNYPFYDTIFYKELYMLGANSGNMPPSSLLRSETALRDPLYYQSVVTFFKEYLIEYAKTQKSYTYDDIAFPGLTIENLDVDKLVTYFEKFDIDLFQIAGKGFKYEDKKPEISARTERLNHVPFSYRISANSDKDADVLVKVYITPKYDPQGRVLPLNERIFYAFEIDRFPAKVTAGKNIIQRKSTESTVAVSDAPTFKEVWNKIIQASNGKETFNVDKFYRPYGFPQNLLLPKGKRNGMAVQFVVAVLPYQEADSTDRRAYDLSSLTLLGTTYGVKYPDPRPISYPIDRPYRSEYDARVPNIFTKEVRIFHKTLDEINNETH